MHDKYNFLDYIKHSFNIIKINLYWIIPTSLFIGAFLGFIEKKKKIEYDVSSKIFPLTSNSGSSAMSDLKAQFGIGKEDDASKIYNINELINSKTISRNIVQSTANKKYRNLAYWILEDQNFNTPFWKSKMNISKMDSNDVVNLASAILISNTNVTTSKSDFTSIKTKAYNEELCIAMNEAILNELSSFYIKSKTEKAREDLYKLGRLKDSVKRNVDMAERGIAGNADSTRYISGLSANLPQLKLQRLVEEYTEQYKAVTIAQQNANFKLLSESPIFQILDKPMRPVNMVYPNWKKQFMIGTIITAILLSLLSLRKLLWKIILDELTKE